LARWRFRVFCETRDFSVCCAARLAEFASLVLFFLPRLPVPDFSLLLCRRFPALNENLRVCSIETERVAFLLLLVPIGGVGALAVPGEKAGLGPERHDRYCRGGFWVRGARDSDFCDDADFRAGRRVFPLLRDLFFRAAVFAAVGIMVAAAGGARLVA
jgi:hypothetical protein